MRKRIETLKKTGSPDKPKLLPCNLRIVSGGAADFTDGQYGRFHIFAELAGRRRQILQQKRDRLAGDHHELHANRNLPLGAGDYHRR